MLEIQHTKPNISFLPHLYYIAVIVRRSAWSICVVCLNEILLSTRTWEEKKNGVFSCVHPVLPLTKTARRLHESNSE